MCSVLSTWSATEWLSTNDSSYSKYQRTTHGFLISLKGSTLSLCSVSLHLNIIGRALKYSDAQALLQAVTSESLGWDAGFSLL